MEASGSQVLTLATEIVSNSQTFLKIERVTQSLEACQTGASAQFGSFT